METTNDNTSPDLMQQFMQLMWLAKRHQLRAWFAQGAQGAHGMQGFMGGQHSGFWRRGSMPPQGQSRVLKLLKLQPEISQKELATILDIRPQSLGELLTKLEKAGYVTRTPSETDRRSMNVSITEAGRAAAEQPEAPTRMDEIFDALTEEEQAQLSAILGKLIAQLQAMQDSEDPEGSRGGGRFGPGLGGGFGRGGGFGGFGFDPRFSPRDGQFQFDLRHYRKAWGKLRAMMDQPKERT